MIEKNILDLLDGKVEPKDDLDKVLKNFYSNSIYAMLPSIVDYEENKFLSFYVGLLKYDVKGIKDLLKSSFENIGYNKFNEKFMDNPERYLLVAQKDNLFYGANIISDSFEGINSIKKHSIEIRLLD